MYENVHYLVFTVLKRVHAVVTLYAAMTFLSVHRQSSGFSLSVNFYVYIRSFYSYKAVGWIISGVHSVG
jgi:hypothetical protein